MKRILTTVLVLALVSLAALAFAQGKSEMKAHGMGMGGKTGTWKGEVLDSGCYISHNAQGAKHKECAMKCASEGMPLLLLVGDKAYLLTPNHDNADPYNQLKSFAGSVVEVTGTLGSRGGISGIDVTGVKAVK